MKTPCDEVSSIREQSDTHLLLSSADRCSHHSCDLPGGSSWAWAESSPGGWVCPLPGETLVHPWLLTLTVVTPAPVKRTGSGTDRCSYSSKTGAISGTLWALDWARLRWPRCLTAAGWNLPESLRELTSNTMRCCTEHKRLSTLGPRCGGTQHCSLPGPSVEESRERVESPALLHMVWTGWETVSGAKLKPRYSLYGRKNKAGGRNRFDCQSGRLGTEEEVVGGLGFSWGPAPGSEADDLITPEFNGCTGLPSSPRAGVNQAEGTSPTPTWRWNFLNIILFVLIQPLVCVPITDEVFMWSAPNTEIHMYFSSK